MSDNFCYNKVERATTKWGENRENFNTAIAIFEKLSI